jgi:hypothetical protein
MSATYHVSGPGKSGFLLRPNAGVGQGSKSRENVDRLAYFWGPPTH